jgi:hypothetical protein
MFLPNLFLGLSSLGIFQASRTISTNSALREVRTATYYDEQQTHLRPIVDSRRIRGLADFIDNNNRSRKSSNTTI